MLYIWIILPFPFIFPSMQTYRTIVKSFTPAERPEGDGALVRRIVGTSQLRNLDPFLMLDHFKVVKPHGFPDHPHRGFETVTYMIHGVMQHEDFKGHAGRIGPGDIQWMTAGKGIMHAEMPATNTVEGLQLWVNLHSEFKMCEPAYQEMKSSDILKVSNDKVNATIIAGRSMGQEARTITRTPTYYIDFKISPNGSHVQEVPRGWNAFLYVLEGSLQVQNTTLKALDAGVLSSQEEAVEFKTQEGTKFVFFAGRPINEPIMQYGPFVMNNQTQIEQTFMDYRLGRNGFEGAQAWSSAIANQ